MPRLASRVEKYKPAERKVHTLLNKVFENSGPNDVVSPTSCYDIDTQSRTIRVFLCLQI